MITACASATEMNPYNNPLVSCVTGLPFQVAANSTFVSGTKMPPKSSVSAVGAPAKQGPVGCVIAGLYPDVVPATGCRHVPTVWLL